jgi:hypothetical protein
VTDILASGAGKGLFLAEDDGTNSGFDRLFTVLVVSAKGVPGGL